MSLTVTLDRLTVEIILMRFIYVDTDNVTKYVDLYLVVSNVHFNPLHNVRGVIDVCSRNLGSLEADLNE